MCSAHVSIVSQGSRPKSYVPACCCPLVREKKWCPIPTLERSLNKITEKQLSDKRTKRTPHTARQTNLTMRTYAQLPPWRRYTQQNTNRESYQLAGRKRAGRAPGPEEPEAVSCRTKPPPRRRLAPSQPSRSRRAARPPALPRSVGLDRGRSVNSQVDGEGPNHGKSKERWEVFYASSHWRHVLRSKPIAHRVDQSEIRDSPPRTTAEVVAAATTKPRQQRRQTVTRVTACPHPRRTQARDSLTEKQRYMATRRCLPSPSFLPFVACGLSARTHNDETGITVRLSTESRL